MKHRKKVHKIKKKFYHVEPIGVGGLIFSVSVRKGFKMTTKTHI